MSGKRQDLQVVTANRLKDGAVVWLGAGGQWFDNINAAKVFAPEKVAEGLADAADAVSRQEIVGPDAIAVTQAGGEIVPVRLRERIRAQGPSIRPKVGRPITLFEDAA
ncbi:DUF2849 domain-containing protein [Afifella marina]|uniref:DUF2849 domain-containing protein n=1 Tax=Afifella marina DSM 2698 TaxID=1120955 RepID=A0A1G5NPN2_AFIMA|nr:DUF2849 domain-containing protein [Afifella marina]MBK1624620.1 DUF2849 domain-containing protein [Afifella marina DSM 2698]MBK1627513.1 DUF2849 domain-containing protein [Afifella marina]MBK5918571.1 hypothetical protein [Afifella marina]RAI18528.1 hypothetical protein CH311_15160 [Afifella marina DSM 2698]SCZ38721.1 Protein of unknown function [Afifella marina DSM 2698]